MNFWNWHIAIFFLEAENDLSEDESEYETDDENNDTKTIKVDNKNFQAASSDTTQNTTQGIYGFENDTHTFTDPNDGSKYFWDRERNAWIPQVFYLNLKNDFTANT